MRNLLILLAAFAISGCASVHAEPIGIRGAGNYSCGKWLQDRADNESQWVANAEWISGFVSGVRFGLKRNVGATTDVAGTVAWMDAHCRSNPFDTIGQAAMKMMKVM